VATTTQDRNRSHRLLLALTYGFSVRYSVPTGLVGSLSRCCELVVGLGWEDEELRSLLEDQGAEVVQLPSASLDHTFRMFRRQLLELRDRRLDSPTTPIRIGRQRAELHGRRDLLIDAVRRRRDRLQLRRPGAIDALEAAESGQVERGTNVAEFRAFLDEHRIDSVVSLTPYHDQDAFLLWAARTTGRPSFTSVISFDNPTTRERLMVRSETIAVWNSFNRSELVRTYPDLAPSAVRITGAPQFDLHRRAELRLSRAEWSDAMGLPPDRPVLLYGAGPSNLVPNERELVLLIDRAISSGRVRGGPHLLVRRHPVDPPDTWRGVGSQLRNGSVVDPWLEGPSAFRSWPTDQDIVLQMSTLAHAEVHVNVCSSMTLDGAVFDRPQIGPAFVPGVGRRDLRRVQDLYRQEHWAPIQRSGGLAVVADEDSLVSELNLALEQPEQRRVGRERMVADVLTFVDGRSTERLVAEIGSALLDDGQR
jgi:hypothetical protein